jgi:hypothetical protein
VSVVVIISMDELQSGVVLIKCKYLCAQRLAIADRLKLEEWVIHKAGTVLPRINECSSFFQTALVSHNPH